MKKKGKHICETLKTIRKQVAEANDIDFEPHECHHEGECAGTCPACEAEVRYLENRLKLRHRLGKAVALVGISAGLIGLPGCGGKKVNYDDYDDDEYLEGDVEVIEGEVEEREGEIILEELAGIPEMPGDDEFMSGDTLTADAPCTNQTAQ